MEFDFDGLEQATTEQEQHTPTTPKAEEPAKPKVDHSVPPRQRIEQERSKLKFEATVFGRMDRQAAKIIGDMILWEFDHYPEREHEWDYNEWTLVDFLKAFSDRAQKMCSSRGGQALFAGRTEDEDDPTMGLVRDIIHSKNEKPKAETKFTPPTTTPTTAPAPKKAKAEKPKPEHGAEQLTLDFDF